MTPAILTLHIMGRASKQSCLPFMIADLAFLLTLLALS